MTAGPFDGFEPEVGEIRAVRTFRLTHHDGLLALTDDFPWPAGVVTARCPLEDEPLHRAPDPDCSCGLYAYADEAAARQSPAARQVLGVVACWGRVVAGTRGLRAEHARLEALWLAPSVAGAVRASIRERYADVPVYTDRKAMFAAHPPTALDCYEAPSNWRRRRQVAVAVVLILALLAPAFGSLPAVVLLLPAVLIAAVALGMVWSDRRAAGP